AALSVRARGRGARALLPRAGERQGCAPARAARDLGHRGGDGQRGRPVGAVRALEHGRAHAVRGDRRFARRARSPARARPLSRPRVAGLARPGAGRHARGLRSLAPRGLRGRGHGAGRPRPGRVREEADPGVNPAATPRRALALLAVAFALPAAVALGLLLREAPPPAVPWLGAARRGPRLPGPPGAAPPLPPHGPAPRAR